MNINENFDYLIIGAGFSGSVLAERIAKIMNKSVLLIEKRSHIGGNAYDYYDEAGVLVHKYGPHIFHTNSPEVFEYLSHFTEWYSYEHRVVAKINGAYYPFPINRTTLNKLYGLNLLTSEEMEDYLDSVREYNVIEDDNSESYILSKLGRELYEMFFENYTKKQWGISAKNLSSDVCRRIPIRFNEDNRYFTDRYQYMPKRGYTALFENMLSSPNITLLLETDYFKIKNSINYDNLIFTGRPDEYYGYRYGVLPYRSVQIEFRTYRRPFYQPYAVVNYPGKERYTRITEYKRITLQDTEYSTVSIETPTGIGEPYYPISSPEGENRFKQYSEVMKAERNVFFTGRLARFKYYNMDQVIAQSLKLFESIKSTL